MKYSAEEIEEIEVLIDTGVSAETIVAWFGSKYSLIAADVARLDNKISAFSPIMDDVKAVLKKIYGNRYQEPAKNDLMFERLWELKFTELDAIITKVQSL